MKKPVLPENYSFTDYTRQHHPDIEDISSLPVNELNALRKGYIETCLSQELGELNEVEKLVSTSISQHKYLSKHLNDKLNSKLSFGQRLADRVADFGGSWTFIIIFFAILLGWMIINVVLLSNKGFDPYPFILLNLVLSCLAAIQAPIIMMSQNRQEEKDRLRNEHDYKVNLKAEVEIRMLHEKLDYILLHQNKRLLEIQKVQVEMMENISRMLHDKKGQ